MNKYSAVSNIELNHAVAVACGYKIISCEESVLAYVDSGYKPFDPCNNPADAMPIVIDNRITMKPHIFESNYWECAWKGFFMSVNKNPYRAAMEVFLMMKDAEDAGKQS